MRMFLVPLQSPRDPDEILAFALVAASDILSRKEEPVPGVVFGAEDEEVPAQYREALSTWASVLVVEGFPGGEACELSYSRNSDGEYVLWFDWDLGAPLLASPPFALF